MQVLVFICSLKQTMAEIGDFVGDEETNSTVSSILACSKNYAVARIHYSDATESNEDEDDDVDEDDDYVHSDAADDKSGEFFVKHAKK